MGWFIILIAGLIGTALFWERKFHYCWKILLSVCFALYAAVFLAPGIIKLFNISGFSGGLKSAAAVGGIFLIVMVALIKISDSLLPDSSELPIPSWFVVFNAASGFFTGTLITAVIIYLAMQTVLSGVPSVKSLRAPSAKTIAAMVNTLNLLSWQTLTPEGEAGLRMLRLLPKQKKSNQAKANNAAPDDKDNISKQETEAESSQKQSGRKKQTKKNFLKRKIKLSQELNDEKNTDGGQ